MKYIDLNAHDYFTRPGPRNTTHGEYSGEWFRDVIIAPFLNQAIKENKVLSVNLDNTEVYAPAFLHEMIVGLLNTYGHSVLTEHFQILSNQRPWYLDEINDYVDEYFRLTFDTINEFQTSN